jgi:hypothetical protein
LVTGNAAAAAILLWMCMSLNLAIRALMQQLKGSWRIKFEYLHAWSDLTMLWTLDCSLTGLQVDCRWWSALTNNTSIMLHINQRLRIF